MHMTHRVADGGRGMLQGAKLPTGTHVGPDDVYLTFQVNVSHVTG